MPVDSDEREKCSVPECEVGVWFTAEHLCRVHGLEAGADIPPADEVSAVDAVEKPSKKAMTAAISEGET